MKSSKSSRFIELDVVRGFAAIWVVSVHFWYVHLLPSFFGYKNFFEYLKNVGPSYSLAKFFPLPLNSFGNLLFDSLNIFGLLGYQGVHIFFVLSGFGLTYSKFFNPDEKWSVFLRKKFVRIYPTYWVLLIIAFIIPWMRAELFYGYYDLPSFWRSLVLLDKAIPYSWFMFPLIQFYLAFFFLFKLLHRYSIRSFLIGAFVIKFVYTLIVLELSYTRFPFLLGDSAYPGYIAISRLFEFCLGMVMAKVYVNNPKQLLSYLSKPSTIGLAIICELVGIVCSFKFANEITVFNYVLPVGISLYDAFIGFGIFVIVFNGARAVIALSKVGENFLNFASKISYEFYLTQFIGLLTVKNLFQFSLPGEPSIITSLRAIMLFALTIAIDIISSLILQRLTNIVVGQVTSRFGRSKVASS